MTTRINQIAAQSILVKILVGIETIALLIGIIKIIYDN